MATAILAAHSVLEDLLGIARSFSVYRLLHFCRNSKLYFYREKAADRVCESWRDCRIDAAAEEELSYKRFV